jgi:hypothetical protein
MTSNCISAGCDVLAITVRDTEEVFVLEYRFCLLCSTEMEIANLTSARPGSLQLVTDTSPTGRRGNSGIYDYTLSCTLAQAVRLLTCIREMLCSNLGRHSEYRNWDLSWFSSVRKGNFSDTISSQATTAFFQIPSQSLFINHPIIRCYVV